MDTWLWIGGFIPVEAVLLAGSRDVRAVALTRERLDSRLARLERLARERGVPLETHDADMLTDLVGFAGHGGVAAQVGPRRMASLSDLFDSPAPALVMLDGVEDPYNFGQAVRSLYAAGIDGLLVRPRNWLSAGVAVRASAGATEFMPTAEVETVEEAAAEARARGLRVAVADEEGASMTTVDLAGPLLLVVGGEKRGVTRSFRRAADLRVRIPYGRPFDHSLGTTAAATALAFEIQRQRTPR